MSDECRTSQRSNSSFEVHRLKLKSVRLKIATMAVLHFPQQSSLPMSSSTAMPLTSEDRFLEAREARTEQRLNRRTHRNDKAERLHAFWKTTRQPLQDWQRRLDDIHQNMSCRTATQRSEVAARLDKLLEDLQALRRQCLSEAENAVELPTADIRLLHEEFINHATRLDQIRLEMCPPTKFVFAKYRAAMQQKEQDRQDNLEESTSESTENPGIEGGECSQSSQAAVVYIGNTVEACASATICVEADGSAHIRPTSNAKPAYLVPPKQTDSASLLLRHLRSCNVTLNGDYKALHLDSISDSTITVSQEIWGAVHITSCRNVQIHGQCHQLRVHDSCNLQLHVIVGSGPILEDSIDIRFYATPDNELVYETKDFNWLRNGIPSPNFCIVPVDATKPGCRSEAEDPACHMGASHQGESEGMVTSQIERQDPAVGTNEESDDEL